MGNIARALAGAAAILVVAWIASANQPGNGVTTALLLGLIGAAAAAIGNGRRRTGGCS